MKSQRVLGKGLGALIKGAEEAGRLGDKAVALVPLSSVATNPNQPRKSFDENGLKEMAASIRQVGVLQPILVRRLRPAESAALAGARAVGPADAADADASGPEYLLVAGERRVRAAALAGLAEIPAIICTYEESEALRVALLENIQREDLGPIEEASAYRDLQEAYGATQEEVAEMLGKSRSTVANALRLLTLEPEVRGMLAAGELSRGHAKALLGLDDPTQRLRLARMCRGRGLSVRECERRVQVLLARGPDGGDGRRGRRRRTAAATEAPEVRALRERAERVLGAPVRLERDARSGKGRIEIRFFSDDDLERLLQAMGVETDLD